MAQYCKECWHALKEGEEQLVDNVVAKHAGADLKLEYSDGTQVTLENYYVECKAGDCDVTVPGKTGEGYKINAASSGGAALGDGSTLVYAHGSPEALMGMAQGNAPMQAALGGPQRCRYYLSAIGVRNR